MRAVRWTFVWSTSREPRWIDGNAKKLAEANSPIRRQPMFCMRASGHQGSCQGVKIMVVIAISGLHGAGKSTAARALVKKFRLKYMSAGAIFRQMAKEKGMSLDDFSLYVERHPSIDRQIDHRTAEFAKKDNVLIDARLAGWMAKGADVKILLYAPLKVRVRRIIKREGRKYMDVLKETAGRERSEAKRFKRFYNIDVNDWSVFDIVLNTEHFGPKEMVRVLELAVRAVTKQKRR